MRVRRRPLAFAYCAALVPALVMALTQPVWSRIDEAQHTDFIIQLSHGIYPVADTTIVAPETLQLMRTTGTFTGAAKGTYPTPDLTDLTPPPPGMSATANAAWMSRHLWQLSFESVQTPAYYLLMVPVWWSADHLFSPVAAVYILRMINALIVASLAPMAYTVARMLVPNRSVVAGVAALFAALLPGLDLNATRVGNDALAAALGGALVLLVVRSIGSTWSWRQTAALGLVFGAGLAVKITIAGLFPALVVAALWPAPGTGWRGCAFRLLMVGGIAALCLLPWFLVNAQHYGSLLPGARTARLSDAAPSQLTPPFIPFDVGVFVLTYWTGEPFGALPLAAPFAVLGALVTMMAFAGLIHVVRSRSIEFNAGRFAVAAAGVAGLVALTLLLPATGGFEFAGPGRYAYAALPAAAALCALGLAGALANLRAIRVVSGVYGAAAAGILLAAAGGLPGVPQPGSGMPGIGSRLVAARASAEVDGVELSIDQLSLDENSKAVWAQITVTNSSGDEVEWSPQPAASAGDAAVTADYLRSTHLPGDLDPGQMVTGWIFIPVDPAALHPEGSLRLKFKHIATHSYNKVSDVELSVPLAGLGQ